MAWICFRIHSSQGIKPETSAEGSPLVAISCCSVGSGLLLLYSGGPMVLGQEVRELLVWRLCEDSLLPQVRGQVAVSLSNRSVRSFCEVSESAGGSLGRGVAIIDAGHLQQLLRNRSADDASPARSRDQPHPDRATLTCHLARDGVRLAQLGTPH